MGRIPCLSSESVWSKMWLSARGSPGSCPGQFQCVTGKICTTGTGAKVREEDWDPWKGDLTGMIAGCVGLKLQVGCRCPGRSWALTGPWEESAWMEHVPCLLVPTALVLFSQHTITTSIPLSSLLAALTPLCAKPLLPACPFCPSLCHRSQAWHLDANPASKMGCSYRWEGFMCIKAAVCIIFFLSADLFHTCDDITGASWADF